MLLRLTPLLLLLATSAAGSQGPPPRQIDGPVVAGVLRVRDGDTVEVAAHVWPMQSVHVAVRLRGIDAPERRGRCEAEAHAAERARLRLVELLGEGPVQLHRVAGDKYFGRVLADMSSDTTPDVARLMLQEGLVDPYDGGRRRDWCGPQAS